MPTTPSRLVTWWVRAMVVALVAGSGLTVLASAAAPPAVAAGEVHPVPQSRVWTVDGHGWGHGRGMSQWGAYSQAQQGRTAQQILDFYYRGTATANYGNPQIRVQLTVMGTGSMSVNPQAGLRVRDVATGLQQVLPTESVRSRWRVRSDAGGLHLEFLDARDGRWYAHLVGGRSAFVGPVQLSADGGASLRAHLATGELRDYPGVLAATQTGGGAMASVNVVAMETYLRGVVPAEVSPSWPPESLEAQAVAARSYSARIIDAASSTAAWDICDTTRCQVYAGLSIAAATTDRAIAATAGQVRTSAGSIINAQFSASNGGWTVDGLATYLPAQPDPYDLVSANPRGTWRLPLSAASLEASYPQVGRLAELEVVRRDGNGEWGGRVLEAVLRGSGGEVRLTSEAALRSGGLYSNYWRIAGAPRTAPIGNLDSTVGVRYGIDVSGWALDPETAAPIDVHLYLDGRYAAAVRADGRRVDVAAAYPGYGAAHGYAARLRAAPGRHQVCAYGINVGTAAPNPLLRCRDVVVSGAPFGSLDTVVARPGSVLVTGWATDPDSALPASVHVSVDGVAVAVTAASSRPDVAVAYPPAGPSRGFSATLGARAGVRTVCASVVNVGPAAPNVPLGCRQVRLPGGNPEGSVDGALRTASGISVRGWALDPDVTAPVVVHVYVDGRMAGPVLASASRPDVAAARPGYGPLHGYAATVSTGPGRHQVCVYAINVLTGSGNTALGCRTVG